MKHASAGRHTAGRQGQFVLVATLAAMVGLGASIVASSQVGQTDGDRQQAGVSQPSGQAAPNAQSAPESTQLEDIGPDAFNAIGEETTGKVCTACHGWTEVFSVRRTPRDWGIVVEDMAGRGAVATEEQLDLITRYLTWSWGLVPVNTATAEDLSAVVGLSKKDAEAVVAYRKEHGPFADLAALKAVPGVDAELLTEQADALLFR